MKRKQKKTSYLIRNRKILIISAGVLLLLVSCTLIAVKLRPKKALSHTENCQQIVEPRERKRAEKAITEANQKYTAATNEARSTAFYDTQKAQIQSATDTWAKAIGATSESYTTTVKNAGCTPLDASQFNVGGLPR
ncbi:MAG TPA: hypothetical protein VLE69_01420 [Candidatus Saccharimonadales bacterium]|nr:hypothetical protein [Candidatus Saccharimonadales bacterium]